MGPGGDGQNAGRKRHGPDSLYEAPHIHGREDQVDPIILKALTMCQIMEVKETFYSNIFLRCWHLFKIVNIYIIAT